MRKMAVWGTAVLVPLVLALAIWGGYVATEAYQAAHFLRGFEAITQAKAPLTVAQVEALMGKPASIEASQTEDQTISGVVYHYPAHGADFKVVFVNGTVFHAECPLPKNT
jgi:hypothetical protein